MSDDRRVQQAVNEFVDRIATIAREIAAEVVLAGVKGPRPSAKVASNGARAKPTAGAKRSPAKLAALTEKLHGFVKSHPGLRVEQINEKLGSETKDLALPIRKLIAEKKIRSVGSRRATRYYPGASAAKGGAKKTKKKK